jgi:hypothetical protein
MATTVIGNNTVYHTTTGPLIGLNTLSSVAIDLSPTLSSLYIQRNSTAGAYAANIYRNSGVRNMQSGIMYGYFRPHALDSSAAGHFGLAFVQSQTDVSVSTGSLYMAAFRYNTTSSSVRLAYIASGGLIGTQTNLQTSSNFTITLGNIYSMVVRWEYSILFNGVRIRVWYKTDGTLSDYENDTPALEQIHVRSAPTSAGEGPFWANIGGGGTTDRIAFDNWYSQRLIVAA